jgi:glycosyltransferase involved in cell wall biosynthesis
MRTRLGEDNVHCAILGGGPYLDRLVRYAQQENVADMITFTGRADDRTICRYLSTTDVAVDPCPYSPHADVSTATKVMEYMFFSLPIVAFDLTETRRSAGDAAVYARRGDESDFAEKIIDLLAAAERRRVLGAVARVRLDSELSWSRSAKRLLELAEQLSRG